MWLSWYNASQILENRQTNEISAMNVLAHCVECFQGVVQGVRTPKEHSDLNELRRQGFESGQGLEVAHICKVKYHRKR